MPVYDQPVYSDLASAIADLSFPGSLMPTYDYIDKDTSRPEETGSFTVPASAPYVARLPVPRSQTDYVLDIGGAPRVIVQPGVSPVAGQIQLDAITGYLEFHSSDAGLTCNWRATFLQSSFMASDWYYVLANLRAMQNEWLNSTPPNGGSLLASISGVDPTVVGDTLLLAATKPFVLTGLGIARESGSGAVTVDPVVSVGIASPDYNDVLLETTIRNFDNAALHSYSVPFIGRSLQVDTSESVYLRVSVASDAAAQSWKVFLRGHAR